MAKIIKYHWLKQEPIETQEGIAYEDVLSPCEIKCATEEILQANIHIAEKESYDGTYSIEGEFDPEEDIATTNDVLNALLGVSE